MCCQWRKLQGLIENTKFGEDVEQLELLHTAGGNKNHTSSLENSLRLSYKVKHTLTIWPLLDIDPREVITDVQRLQTNVPSSFIHSWQKARNNPNTSINWWMEKQSLAYIYNGTLLSKKRIFDTPATWIDFKMIMMYEKSQTKWVQTLWLHLNEISENAS